jgi:hypothetical protein
MQGVIIAQARRQTHIQFQMNKKNPGHLTGVSIGASYEAIEVWGLPVQRHDAPGTVNLHSQHTHGRLKICKADVVKS